MSPLDLGTDLAISVRGYAATSAMKCWQLVCKLSFTSKVCGAVWRWADSLLKILLLQPVVLLLGFIYLAMHSQPVIPSAT
jgi:hypothetical protein